MRACVRPAIIIGPPCFTPWWNPAGEKMETSEKKGEGRVTGTAAARNKGTHLDPDLKVLGVARNERLPLG